MTQGNTAEWTPASIFVASDHLVQKLVRNYFIRREKGEDERQEERFAKAVFELHTTIFYSFEEHWTHMHGLSIRPQVMQVRATPRGGHGKHTGTTAFGGCGARLCGRASSGRLG